MIELYPENDARREVSALCTACLAAPVARRIDFSRERVSLTIGRHKPIPDPPASIIASTPEEPAGAIGGNNGASVACVIAVAEVDGLRRLRGWTPTRGRAAGGAAARDSARVSSAAAIPSDRCRSAVRRAGVALVVVPRSRAHAAASGCQEHHDHDPSDRSHRSHSTTLGVLEPPRWLRQATASGVLSFRTDVVTTS